MIPKNKYREAFADFVDYTDYRDYSAEIKIVAEIKRIKCPICDGELRLLKNVSEQYCAYCGQKLKWGE